METGETFTHFEVFIRMNTKWNMPCKLYNIEVFSGGEKKTIVPEKLVKSMIVIIYLAHAARDY